MDSEKLPRKLWEHPDPKSTAIWRFMQAANEKFGLNMQDFPSLYKWSCDNRNSFYMFFFDNYPLIYQGSYNLAVDESIPISKLPRWFDGIQLNYAENFLWSRTLEDDTGARTTKTKEDSKIALTEVREGNTEVKHVTWAELRRRVANLASAFHQRGLKKGDRVVLVGQHSTSTLVVFLATTWLGALFSSSSTDMGVGGLLQRTVQIDPKFVFFDDASLYGGKYIDLHDKIQGVMQGLQECPSFQTIIINTRFADKPYATDDISKTERLEYFLLLGKSKRPPPPERINFQDPMVVYYSSGTTGTPKAIVHGVGSILLNAAKEATLHQDATPDSVNLQFTTTGWIMFLASVTQMQFGGRSILYDGSPFIPDHTVLLRVAEEQGATSLGVSPRWMGELKRRNIVPKAVADLSKLTRVLSTGMVLPDQMFEWFYDAAFPAHVQLCNTSGGTDIAGAFVLENPLMPVHVGGCVGPALGVQIAVYEHDLPEGSDGKPLPAGEAGDLVATAAFPNIPLYLWGDSQPAPGQRYMDSYFKRFNNVWTQGDFCAFHPITGGILMLGRSDGVLNPSGIRFGSSDIYGIIEKYFAAEVADSLCVGQRRKTDIDERVFLFLIMKPGKRLNEALSKAVKRTIARELTKRHVPRFIFETPEIPTTINGKKVELPVKSILSGKRVKPSAMLFNPASLEYFYQFQKVDELGQGKALL